jgi:hypothetical protein
MTAELFDDLSMEVTLEEGVPFTNLYMEPFNRSQMRRLIERWDLRPAVNREAVFERVENDIVHVNVPLTAMNGTILLTIFETHADFTSTNKAVLIQTFVETLLEKHGSDEPRRSRFDFINKAHFASHMALNDRYRLNYDELIGLARRWFDEVGLHDQSREQVDNFIRARVLAGKDGIVTFRYRAFLEHFIAARMDQDASFMEWALGEERYLSFWNIDLHTIDNVTTPNDELKTGWFQDIERQINAPAWRRNKEMIAWRRNCLET